MAMDILNRPGLQPESPNIRSSAVKPSTAGHVSAPDDVTANPPVERAPEVSMPEKPAGMAADQGQAVNNAVKSLNDAVQNIRRELEFSVDEESGRTIIKVLDSETGDVIRESPPEELLAAAKSIKEFMESRESALETGGQSDEALGFIMRVQA
jgi:flagellar protein FlaG